MHHSSSSCTCQTYLLYTLTWDEPIVIAVSFEPTHHVLARRLDAAVGKLSKSLQQCGSLPLKVTSVQPLSASLRHMAAFAPQPSVLAGSLGSGGAGVPRVMEAAEMLVTLEGSGETLHQDQYAHNDNRMFNPRAHM